MPATVPTDLKKAHAEKQLFLAGDLLGTRLKRDSASIEG
jgi:hypothetical protein